MLDAAMVGPALEALVATSPNGMAVLDAGSVVLHANRAMAELLGVPVEALLGEPLLDFAHPADRDVLESSIRLAEDRPPRQQRHRFRRADGAEAVFEVLVTALPGADGAGQLVVVHTTPDSDAGALVSPARRAGPGRVRTWQARAFEAAASALAGAVTLADITAIMEHQVDAFQADGSLIALADGPVLRLASAYGYPDAVRAVLAEQSMNEPAPMVEVVQQRTVMFLETLQEYCTAYPERTQTAHQTLKQAWAFLPMVAGGRVIGCWCLSYAAPHRFSVAERALLSTLSGLLAQAVARTEVLAAERSLTRTLQRSLLPASIPEVPGCGIAVRYSTAVAGLEVGGDFYDVIPLPNGGTGIVIGDAQGHSAAAAALMGQVRAALRAYAAEGHDPATIVARANRFLVTADVDSFVTCTYAALDATHDGVTIVRAGHPQPLLVTPDGAAGWLDVPGGLPLGIEPQAAYPVTWVPLTVGCRIVLYTDGLVEERGADLAVGETALLRRVRAGRELALEDFADAVLGPEVDREDDVAVLVLERVADPSGDGKRQALFTAESIDPAQVRDVRRAVAQQCREWGWAPRADEVELLVSELVTNAVVHVGGTVLVTVTASDHELTVAVGDTSVHTPAPEDASVWDTNGRGLSIVESLADRWGVDPSGPGKSVWFSLRAQRRSA